MNDKEQDLTSAATGREAPYGISLLVQPGSIATPRKAVLSQCMVIALYTTWEVGGYRHIAKD